MNALDVALILFALSAVFGGWRAGFVHRAFSWLGLFGGILVASIVLRRIASATEVATDAPALLRSLAVLVVGAVLGNAVGTWLGSRASAAVDESAFDLLDSAGGALLGLASTALMAWMVLPTMTMVPGWPADIARSSVVASRLNRALGPAPDVLDGVSQSLGLGAFDGLWHLMEQIDIGGLQPEAPLETPLSTEVTDSAIESTVRVRAETCEVLSLGSGVVVSPGVVVTNAHVIAGATRIELSNDQGLTQTATLHAVDTHRDVAVLFAKELDVAALPLTEDQTAPDGAIFGFPGGGSLAISPFSLAGQRTVNSTDIYGQDSSARDVLILGSRISPGVSGGPLISPEGQVEGLAFGVAPDDPQTAYGIPAQSVREVLETASPVPVPSGSCLR